jgi:two-component system OmpR family response regulator
VDVVLAHWPEEATTVERLRASGTPRLLLVAPDAAPPTGGDCTEDWLRLPADDLDVHTRMLALRARAARHNRRPEVDRDGRLSFRDRWVALSQIDLRLARALTDQFAAVVSTEHLAQAGWPHGIPSGNALRVHLTRLRQRIKPLGLEIRAVPARGYVLQQAS